MNRLILAIVLCFIPSLSFGQTRATADPHFIDPFEEIYDSYMSHSIRNYELIPKISDNHNLADVATKTDAIAKAKKVALSSKYSTWLPNATTTGDHTAELRGPVVIDKKNVYFWIVRGHIKHYLDRQNSSTYYARTSKKPTTEPYTLIFHSYKSGTVVYDKAVIFSVGNRRNELDQITLETVNKFVNPLREKNNERLYNTAIKKNTWTNNSRSYSGTLEKYTTGRIVIKDENDKTLSLVVKNLSNNDKVILRGYLDHLNISVQ